MGVTETPQWLVPAFVRSARAIGAEAPKEQIEAVAQALLASWDSGDRHHHAVRHLMDVLASIDQLAEETHDPDLVRIAGWYHGAEFSSARRASYAHRGGEDPMASAQRARRELAELGVPAQTVERVAGLVEQVHRHSASTTDVDAQALSDADLAGLAAEPQRYAEYRRKIRAEYSHIPQEDYLEARIAILHKIAARPHIFCSPMGQLWEEPARENIAAELERLESELEQLEATARQRTTELRPVLDEPAHDGGATPGSTSATSMGGWPGDGSGTLGVTEGHGTSRPSSDADARRGDRTDPDRGERYRTIDPGEVTDRDSADEDGEEWDESEGSKEEDSEEERADEPTDRAPARPRLSPAFDEDGDSTTTLGRIPRYVPRS